MLFDYAFFGGMVSILILAAERHQRFLEYLDKLKYGKRPRIRALWEITMTKKTKPEMR
jgi:hypothetical protein